MFTLLLFVLVAAAVLAGAANACAGAHKSIHRARVLAPHVACALVGDSIASPQGLGAQFPSCYDGAVKGMGSSWIAKHAWASGAFCIVSAGSNDIPPTGLRANLETILKRLRCSKVAFVSPAHAAQRAIVEDFAAGHGDPTVRFAPGPDGIHPQSYPRLASDIGTAFALEAAAALPAWTPSKYAAPIPRQPAPRKPYEHGRHAIAHHHRRHAIRHRQAVHGAHRR